ncbi:hypothetical protein ACM1PE_08740 [Achromobacter sp. PD1]|uniref:hypothetical protein n=1 Tax=Achromobacter sp. PD1 TaxID=3399125 RepID=UPI003AF63721
MTDQTTAAQAHEIRFSDDQLMAIATAAWEVHSNEAYSPDGLLMACVAVQAALLSKLRAPVANERPVKPHAGHQDLAEAWQKGFDDEPPVLRAGRIYFDAYREGQAAHAALASASVAGEAVAEVQIDPHSPPDDERAIIVPLVDFEAVDAGTKLYAAAQASEAVRDALRSAAQQITDLYEGDEWPELAQVLHVLDALSSQPGAQKGGNDA